ncbi:hypothetical protein ACIBI8_40485 [Streptomyces sp. NPDC050529]|uniref:hypothetical protein n=1 Tax=Streptomyces sp. NPDC050529 TaxID=3365624 RepID=UPI0037A28E2D
MKRRLASLSPLQKRTALAVTVLLLALFPNLLTVVVPVVSILGWAVGQPLIAGIAVGAVFFAHRRGVSA